MKRSIWFWVYFIIAIVLAIYLATRIVMTGLGHGSAAHVHTISISADSRDKDLSELATAAATAPGTRTYSVNLNDIATRTNAVPGVKHSAVRRHPNGNLSVRAKMHNAIAQWTDGQHFYPLSADGTIVQRPEDTRDAASVVFMGRLPNNIDTITRAAHNLVGDLDYMEWIENRRWNLITTGGITVMLPEQDPASAIGALILLNKNHNILAKDLRIIDMRDPARILVK